jgi:hypothetical protein
MKALQEHASGKKDLPLLKTQSIYTTLRPFLHDLVQILMGKGLVRRNCESHFASQASYLLP